MAPADDGTADHNVVFIDTSLETRLAMNVSESDTVSEFKQKIVLEHRLLFPAMGDVKIECLKVKQKGNFYHLADSMLVKSAFDASKRNWFVSADASCLEQNDGIQHPGKHKAGDQLALPWVTHSRSIERHDNHGSPSTHSKVVPSVNQRVFNSDQLTSGDSCKDTSKNAVEDKSYNDDKQLNYDLHENLYTVHTNISSKKRTRDFHNESSIKDSFEPGPSLKKKHKTQRVKRDVKASEENLIPTHDNGKVNDKGASINKGDSFKHKSKGNDLIDEDSKINGEKCSAFDQVDIVVPGIEGVGSENGVVAMLAENDSHQEMSTGISQQEKDSKLVQKTAMENEIDSLLMKTPDCEPDAAGVTAVGHIKHSTRHKAAEKEVFSQSSTKTLHNTKKDATKSSSQQDAGSNSQERAGDQIDKHKDDLEISLKQRTELKPPERKKGAMGCENIGEGKRRKNKKLFKHADSKVPATVIDERKMKEDSEITLVDAKKGDDVIVNKAESSVENMEEKSRKEFTDTIDAATVTNAENLVPHSETLVKNDAEILSGKNTSQVNAQGILDNLEGQNVKTGAITKKKKKRKTEKSAGSNENNSITKHDNGDICENVKEVRSSLPDAIRKDVDMSSTVLDPVIDERKMNEDLEKTLVDARKGDNVIVNKMEVSVENMEENSRKEFTDNNEVATLRNEENLLPNSESLMNNDADISTTGRNISQVNAPGILGKLVNQNEKMEGTMKKKKKKKTKKSAGRNEDESIAKHANCDIYENVKEGSLPEADRKDGGMSSTGIALFVDEKTKNEVSVKTLIDAKKGDDVNVNRVDISVENMKENSRKEFTDTNDVATVTTEENLLRRSVRLMKNDADITTGKNISQVNAQSEGQDEKTDDTTKKKKKRKTRNSVERMEEESIIKHVKEGESSLADTNRKDGDKVKEKIAKSYEGLVGKANKNNKSQNLPTKHQSTDVNLESKKSPSIDHHHLPEKASKNVISTEVSKVNNEVDVPEDESHEIEFRDYLVPGHKPKENTSLDNRKDMKKTKDDSWNDQSQKIFLQNVNKVPINVLKDPNVTNINKINTTESTKKINSQKMPRQSDAGQTRDKTVKKKSVNSSQQTKSLLTAPLKIFGEDSDDNAAVNSDSSTRTPSRNSSSSSSSSSGESAYSIVSRRNTNEGAGKNNMKSELGKLNDLFRSASSFKKVKVTASSQVEDTESQVDFVPESQLMGN
ncbi:hypothetical protein R6Q59_024111 [Mikania micrantha]